MLKSYLLSLGCFVDNEYLDEYLSFIEQPFSFSSTEYTEKHHVIPRSYYNSDYSKSASTEDISLNDPNNKLVELTYSDHFYAHWLLFNCTTNRLKSSNAKALLTMSGKSDILHFSKEAIKQICNEIKHNLDYYWSPEGDARLIKLYNTGASAETIESIAKALNRTPDAIRSRIVTLKLSDRMWTSEEETWLKLNYADLGKEACAQHLNRTPSSIEHKVTNLQISDRLWTDEDTEWLITNYATTPTAVCAEFLDRSVRSVMAKAIRLNLTKAIPWTPAEDAWLQENLPANTWQYCSDYLGRNIYSIKQRASQLKIPNNCSSNLPKKVRCKETGELFISVSQACKKYGLNVKSNLRGKLKSVNGLHFEYAVGCN